MGCFYKKVDSTLRGNLGAELAAFRAATSAPGLPFAPAFPSVGRTTRRGRQLVDGVPLGRTAFARDPLHPVRTGSIATLLARQTDVRVRHVSGSARGAASETSYTEGIAIFDAASDGELRQVARRLRAAGLLSATAGSGGFAAALAQTLDFGGRRRARRPAARAAGPARPLLVVCGSRHPAVARQIAAAVQAGFQRIAIPAPWLVSLARRRSTFDGAMDVVAARADTLLGTGGDVVLHVSDAPGEARATGHATAVAVARGAGRVVAEILARRRVGAVLATGGDTLAGVVAACGWQRLEAETAIASGIALVRTHDSRAPRLVGKAGGFGGDRVWIEVRDWLRSGA